MSDRQAIIEDINDNIIKWQQLIFDAKMPILYYVIKSFYTLDGKYCEEIVLLITEYKPL